MSVRKIWPTNAVDLVRRWLTEAAKVPVDPSAQQLAGVQRPQWPRLHGRFRRRSGPPRRLFRRRSESSWSSPRKPRHSCRGTCAPQ